MALVTSSERPAADSSPFSPLGAIVRWFANAAEARAKRVAMRSLMEMDDSRLSDLGLCRQDILEALSGGTPLNVRRDERVRLNRRP